MAELDRQVLFQNEAFAIGVLQAVSGAAAAGTLAQFTELSNFVGQIPVLIFLTFMGLALVCAVLAAYFRYRYKMWDVKGSATKDNAKSTNRKAKARRDLRVTRWSMTIAVLSLCVGFVELVGFLWWDFAVAEWVRGWREKPA